MESGVQTQQEEMEEGAQLCTVDPKGSGLHCLGEHTPETAAYWTRQDVECAATQVGLEINDKRHKLVRECKLCRIKTLKPSLLQNLGVTESSRPMQQMAVDLWSCTFGTAVIAMDLHSQYPFVFLIICGEYMCHVRDSCSCGHTKRNGKEFTSKEFEETGEKEESSTSLPPYQ